MSRRGYIKKAKVVRARAREYVERSIMFEFYHKDMGKQGKAVPRRMPIYTALRAYCEEYWPGIILPDCHRISRFLRERSWRPGRCRDLFLEKQHLKTMRN